MTIREHKGSLDGLKMCFIGDGNNMMNSLIVGCLKMKMEVAVACPNDYKPNAMVLDFAVQHPAFSITNDPKEAARGADVVITDVWLPWARKKRRRSAVKRSRASRSTTRSCPWAKRTRCPALPAGAPRRGDHSGDLGEAFHRDLRRGGKPPACAEGGFGQALGQKIKYFRTAKGFLEKDTRSPVFLYEAKLSRFRKIKIHYFLFRSSPALKFLRAVFLYEHTAMGRKGEDRFKML